MTASVPRLLVPALFIALGGFGVLHIGPAPAALASPGIFERNRGGRPPALPAKYATPQPAQPESRGILPASIIAQIPQAVNDRSGQAAGVVNVIIVGSEANAKLTIGTAQWQTVASSPETPAALRAEEQQLDAQAYVNSPLSQLFLYGRAQDYSFTHDDPNAEVKTRHCLRLWRAPFTVGGVTAWVGEIVHDVPWWDEKNGTVSDKPATDVDRERDFLRDTLNSTGLVAQSGYVQRPGAPGPDAAPDGPITVGDYATDGRVLVMFMLNLPAR